MNGFETMSGGTSCRFLMSLWRAGWESSRASASFVRLVVRRWRLNTTAISIRAITTFILRTNSATSSRIRWARWSTRASSGRSARTSTIRCRECDYRFACNGECPKHRFLRTPDGEEGLNYLCQGYKIFFKHVDPFMRFMAEELRQERPPANVMEWVRQRDLGSSHNRPPGRN